ncbi:DUF3576 domain-containing protein [Sagittula marina]
MRVQQAFSWEYIDMTQRSAPSRVWLGIGIAVALSATASCGMMGDRTEREPVVTPSSDEILGEIKDREGARGRSKSSVLDIFKSRGDQGQVGQVNKYLWNASLEVLNFLPIETVDPFTGVITTGYGTPPGGGRAYRATILINDPALDARSLNLALLTPNGPASASTVRAIEDAILTRARQIRARDARL